MTSMLLVTSSISAGNSKSRQIADIVVDAIRAEISEIDLVVRDLAARPPSHPGAPSADPSDEAEQLIAELEKADAVIVAAPMYNFTIPSSLKAWLDHVIHAGRTFSYSAEGVPSGLLKGKPTILVLSRGGDYSASPLDRLDFQLPYLSHALGFIGLDQPKIILVHAQAMAAETAASRLREAEELARTTAHEVAAQLKQAALEGTQA